jgi:hypothetical protein
MPRRVNLPPADELFRKTTPETKPAPAAGPDEASDAAGHASGGRGSGSHPGRRAGEARRDLIGLLGGWPRLIQLVAVSSELKTL